MSYIIRNKKTGNIPYTSESKAQRDDHFSISLTLHLSMGGREDNFPFERVNEEDPNKVVNLIDSNPNDTANTYIPHFSDEEVREMFEAEELGNLMHPLLKIEGEEDGN